MEKSPSWDATMSSASQEILLILWKMDVPYHIHKSLPPVCIVCQINLVHAPSPTSWIFILRLSSHLHLDLQSGLFLSGFLTKTMHAPRLSPICATCLTHIILLGLITPIISGEECRSWRSLLFSLLHAPVSLFVCYFKSELLLFSLHMFSFLWVCLC
jgi:hypothetical protein